MLVELKNDAGLSDEESRFRELLLRKTMDGIATTFLRDRIHLMRRLIIHEDAPQINLTLLQESLAAANKLNEESRMTFDVAGFVWLCRHRVGIEIEFGTRREAAKIAQEYGGKNLLTWGGRALSIRNRSGWWTLCGGILSRFANDLSNPLAFVTGYRDSEFPTAREQLKQT
jgi:hypothetical protein